MSMFWVLYVVKELVSPHQTCSDAPIPCNQRIAVFYAVFPASSSISLRRSAAMVPNFQRLCDRIHHWIRIFRWVNPLLFSGFPKYAFLKIPIRASVAPRLVCKRQNSSSSNREVSSLTDRGQIALKIPSSSKWKVSIPGHKQAYVLG